MVNINLPSHVSVWLLSFLVNRSQFVSVNNMCSEFTTTNAGAPQGTSCGPLAFNLLINDLVFNLDYLKYVDDTTAVSVSDDPLDDSLQSATDDLSNWCDENGMRINVFKTKEMLIYFGKNYPRGAVPNLVINNSTIERVSTFKLLGVYFNNDLTWSDHVAYIVTKACKRIYCIKQLVHAGIASKDVIIVYCSIIRSILDYCCQIWHPGLTKQQSKEIEAVQKRCLKIIYPAVSYATSLKIASLERLSDRRERLVKELFNEIKANGLLSSLLEKRKSSKILRKNYNFKIPKISSYRTRRDFITYCLFKIINLRPTSFILQLCFTFILSFLSFLSFFVFSF